MKKVDEKKENLTKPLSVSCSCNIVKILSHLFLQNNTFIDKTLPPHWQQSKNPIANDL